MKKLEIRKEDLKNNLKIVKSRINNDVKVIAVVKANGMGLDLIEYSKFLVENKIDYLAVASYKDALTLREVNINVNILLLTPCIDRYYLEMLIKNNIILTVSNQDEILLAEEVGNSIGIKNVRMHLKIDTGFARYGFIYTEPENILKAILNVSKINLEGIYTHFSEPRDAKWTKIQFERFTKIIDYLHNNGYDFKLKHCAASSAFMRYPNMRLDAIRIGSTLLGRTTLKVEGLKRIGSLKSYVLEIKNLPKGYNISYTNTYKTKKETRIATIPVGYMDGFNAGRLRDDYSLKNNLLSIGMEIKKLFKDNSLKVSINGKEYKVIGRLGMYHCIVDITGSTVNVGDEVTFDISPLNVPSEVRREYI